MRNDRPLSRRAARPGSERGFTLVETSLAMVLMMIVGLASASLFTWAVNYNQGAASRELAGLLAQQRLERLRTVPFDSTTRNLPLANGGLGATVAAGVDEANVMSGGRPFNVNTRIENIAFDTLPAPQPTLKRITVTVTPTGSGARLGVVRLTTLRTTLIKGTY